jgi:hypothetical protein
MPLARLCSIAATMRRAANAWRGREVLAGLGGHRAVAQHVEVALELRGEVLLEELPRRWVARSMALRVSLSILAHPLLNDDLLAGADEARALFADAVERGVELLFGLDAAARSSCRRSR